MKLTFGGFSGRLQTVSLGVVKPAMIRAGDAPFLDPPITKRRAAVRAAIVQQTDVAFLVAKQHQGLAENPYDLRGAFSGKLARDADGKPIAPQQFTGGGPRAYARDFFIFFPSEHGRILRP